RRASIQGFSQARPGTADLHSWTDEHSGEHHPRPLADGGRRTRAARRGARTWRVCSRAEALSAEPLRQNLCRPAGLAASWSGDALDALTRNPLVRNSLRMMRSPARAAGLGELQNFLEAGFDAFRAMRGAREFLDDIGRRERALATALFSAARHMAAADGTARH